jgi:hypothetical protein
LFFLKKKKQEEQASIILHYSDTHIPAQESREIQIEAMTVQKETRRKMKAVANICFYEENRKSTTCSCYMR